MLARSSSQAGFSSIPRSEMSLFSSSQSNALFVLLLWLCKVLAVRPVEASCNRARSA